MCGTCSMSHRVVGAAVRLFKGQGGGLRLFPSSDAAGLAVACVQRSPAHAPPPPMAPPPPGWQRPAQQVDTQSAIKTLSISTALHFAPPVPGEGGEDLLRSLVAVVPTSSKHAADPPCRPFLGALRPW